MTEGLVSIIIPVYNGEIFLARCLESLLSQSYEKLEIIIVDDCSKDNSAAICEDYAAKDSRINLIRKENTGVSDTRNTGIDHASGEFIVFVDCDDYVDRDHIANLVSLMSSDVDFGVTGWKKEKENGDFIENCVSITGDMSADECMRKIVAVSAVQGYPFARIFRTSIIKDKGLYFDKKIIMFEDLLFCCTYLNYCSKTKMNTSCVDYHYIMRDSSSRNKAVHSQTFNTKWITEIDSLKKLLSVVDHSKAARKSVRARIALSSSFYINRMFDCNYVDKQLQKELQKNIRKNFGPLLFSPEGDFKWRTQAVLCAISPSFEYKLKNK